jgi:hypothetical protein
MSSVRHYRTLFLKIICIIKSLPYSQLGLTWASHGSLHISTKWLGNWSVLTAGCRWNVPTCISMFDALTLESEWAGCAVSVFCLMFCPASASEKWLSEAAWLARLGPAWFCFGLLSATFDLLFAVFPVSSGLLGRSSVFCELHFMRVVYIDGLFCDGNWCWFKNLKTVFDITLYMTM